MNPESKLAKDLIIRIGKLAKRSNCLLKFPKVSADHMAEFYSIAEIISPVLKILKDFDDNHYNILELQYIKGFSQDEVAEELSYSKSYIKKRSSILLNQISCSLNTKEILNNTEKFYPNKNKKKIAATKKKLKSYNYNESAKEAKTRYAMGQKLKKIDANISHLEKQAFVAYYNFVEYNKALAELSPEEKEIILSKNSRFILSAKDLTKSKFYKQVSIKVNDNWYHSKKTPKSILDPQQPEIIYNKRNQAFDEMSKIVNFI